MVNFKPMSAEEFAQWRDRGVKEYAEDKVRVGNASRDQALEAANQQLEALLPNGLETPDTYLFNVVDQNTQKTVGTLWIQIRNQRQEIFLADVRVHEQYRRRGFGRETMRALEAFAKDMGIPKISLHVFGDNDAALRLYRSVGFVVTNVLMSKEVLE